MSYNLQDDSNLRDETDDLVDSDLNPYLGSKSYMLQKPEDLAHFLHRGHFYSANPKNLMRKRKRYDWYQIIIKSLTLLFSPRTILVQCESFLFIFLVTILDKDNEYTKNFGMSVDIRVITLMISFCIIFAINQSFARRERTLQDIATLKASIIVVYYSMCWIYENDDDKKANVFMTCKHLLKYVSQYLYDRNELIRDKLYSEKQNSAVQHFYSDINRLLRLIFNNGSKYKRTSVLNNRDSMYSDSITNSRIPPPAEAVLISKIYSVLESFERLCATKDYLTPLGIRAFTSFMLWFLPLILAPYFVWHTDKNISGIASYSWAWLFFLMLGALADVKAILDDIFDGDSLQDDIILDIDNILHNMKYGGSPLVQDLYHDHST